MLKNHKNLFRLLAVVGVILLPLLAYAFFVWKTAYPKQVVIGTGPEGGLYRKIAEALEAELESQGRDVEIVHTNGSLENYYLLKRGALDFVLYQPGVLEAFAELDSASLQQAEESAATQRNDEGDLLAAVEEPGEVTFVANLYSQPVHLFVRKEAHIDPQDLSTSLRGRPIAVGPNASGDYGMALMLLDHFGLSASDLDVRHLDLDGQEYFTRVEQDFAAGRLDAAFVTMGVRAPVLDRLSESGTCEIVDLPYWEALMRNYTYLYEFTIPPGFYGAPPRSLPGEQVQTVAVGAQLLSREDVNEFLVQAVTRIVLDRNFAEIAHLRELSDGGPDFAQESPEFPIHRGAKSVYNPESFDIHLIESWEASYSLLGSVCIALIFAYKWLRDTRERSKEHKLDRYIRALLDIEERQAPLDRLPRPAHIEELQNLLAEVSTLRQAALREFTAHQLNEDRGIDCFVEMCHALSNKINAKLSRQRLDVVMCDLIDAIKGLESRLGRHADPPGSTEFETNPPHQPI